MLGDIAAMIAAIVLIAIVGGTAVAAFTLDLRPPDTRTLGDRESSNRGRAVNIAKLHRELGIDPIYDPGPYLPTPIEPEKPALMREHYGQIMPTGVPLTITPVAPEVRVQGRIFSCTLCDWCISATQELATGSYVRHLQDKHGIR